MPDQLYGSAPGASSLDTATILRAAGANPAARPMRSLETLEARLRQAFSALEAIQHARARIGVAHDTMVG